MIVAIIGLSASGKTTLAKDLCNKLRLIGCPVVHVDGDVVRNIWGDSLGHDLNDRRKNADRILNLANFIEKEGVIVVCSYLSVFAETRECMASSAEQYIEISIESDWDTLESRDPKGLYSRFKLGVQDQVAGRDIYFPPPVNPDFTIVNNDSLETFLSHSDVIIEYLLDRLKAC